MFEVSMEIELIQVDATSTDGREWKVVLGNTEMPEQTHILTMTGEQVSALFAVALHPDAMPAGNAKCMPCLNPPLSALSQTYGQYRNRTQGQPPCQWLLPSIHCNANSG